jgi:hypothetical protein
MVPLLHGAMVNGAGVDAVVAPGGVTDSVVEEAQLVSVPVVTSEYWKVNSACCVAVRVTSVGGAVGGPDKLTVNPSTTVVATGAPVESKRANEG